MKFRGRLIRHDQQCHKSYRAIIRPHQVHLSFTRAVLLNARNVGTRTYTTKISGGMDHTEWKAAREKAKTEQADLEAQMTDIDRGRILADLVTADDVRAKWRASVLIDNGK